MRTTDDLIRDSETFLQELQTALPNVAKVMANDLTAAAMRKLHEEGVKGAKYSENPMLATQAIFLQKAKFKPDVIATELGRDEASNLVKGGLRTKSGGINRKKTKPRWRWIKFKNARRAVPVMFLQHGYRQLRQIQGLPVDKVDLTYTGRMTQQGSIIAVGEDKKSPYKILVLMGGRDEDVKRKLKYNRVRYGDFLDIPEEYKEAAVENVKDVIGELIKKHFKL